MEIVRNQNARIEWHRTNVSEIFLKILYLFIQPWTTCLFKYSLMHRLPVNPVDEA